MADLYLPFFDVYLPLVAVWLAVVIVGLALGSFLTCVIYRVPRGLSVWRRGRSFCPACQKQLAAKDLIPILSYVIQRGRCRYCAHPIGISYLLIEVVTLILVLVTAALTLF